MQISEHEATVATPNINYHSQHNRNIHQQYQHQMGINGVATTMTAPTPTPGALAAKAKLNEFFIQWLTLPETHDQIQLLLLDEKQRHHENVCDYSIGNSINNNENMDVDMLSAGEHHHLRAGLGLEIPSASDLMDICTTSPHRSPKYAGNKRNLPRSPSNASNSPSHTISHKPGFSALDKITPFQKRLEDLELDEERKRNNAAANQQQQQQVPQILVEQPPQQGTQPLATIQQKQPQPQSQFQKKLPSADAIPQFYFPQGIPLPKELAKQELDKINAHFAKFNSESEGLRINEFSLITKDLRFPTFFSSLLFYRIDTQNTGVVTRRMMEQFWKKNLNSSDEALRYYNVLKNPNNTKGIHATDFYPVLNELLETHPGLDFLKSTGFQERYAETVIVRIFYTVNRSRSGYITLKELKNSNLIQVMKVLDEEEDINMVRDYFSYEHFYVLYCKFWELDTDHDFQIDREDLMRYANYSLTYRIVDRIFEGAPKKLTSGVEGKMSYEDFIWFCLSEEDKTADMSLEYWFRCIDLDGDGFISGYEIEYFYWEQLGRMENMSQEVISLEDILVQMIDMIKPEDARRITLRDIKRCRMAGVFFNALFNLNKFIAYESRDPLAAHQDRMLGEKLSDWDKFARIEYDKMAAEDEQNEEMSGEYFSSNTAEAPF